MESLPDGIYADAINRAAMMLVAMSVRPNLQSALVDEVSAAVIVRGGQIDGQWLTKFDLHAVFEEIAERTTAILSAALRERLPGIADEIDEAFGGQLRRLLGSMTPLFPTL
jgi:hypothetical protein